MASARGTFQGGEGKWRGGRWVSPAGLRGALGARAVEELEELDDLIVLHFAVGRQEVERQLQPRPVIRMVLPSVVLER